MRLRIFDLNTPWFWLTMFYNPNPYGKPWLETSLWKPNSWKRFWVNVWQWEPMPALGGQYSINQTEELGDSW